MFKKKYQKPKITEKKVKMSFFLSNVAFLDSSRIIGTAFAASGSCSTGGGSCSSNSGSGACSSGCGGSLGSSTGFCASQGCGNSTGCGSCFCGTSSSPCS